MNEVADKINQQLEKTIEFRYCILLAIFVLFLDFCLAIFHNSYISQLSYEAITSYKLGNTVIFFVLFVFFMSFVVPLARYVLWFVSTLIPHNVLQLLVVMNGRMLIKKITFIYINLSITL